MTKAKLCRDVAKEKMKHRLGVLQAIDKLRENACKIKVFFEANEISGVHGLDFDKLRLAMLEEGTIAKCPRIPGNLVMTTKGIQLLVKHRGKE